MSAVTGLTDHNDTNTKGYRVGRLLTLLADQISSLHCFRCFGHAKFVIKLAATRFKVSLHQQNAVTCRMHCVYNRMPIVSTIWESFHSCLNAQHSIQVSLLQKNAESLTSCWSRLRELAMAVFLSCVSFLHSRQQLTWLVTLSALHNASECL